MTGGGRFDEDDRSGRVPIEKLMDFELVIECLRETHKERKKNRDGKRVSKAHGLFNCSGQITPLAIPI